jgi:hypothetical protein
VSDLSERNVRRLSELQAKLLSMGVKDIRLYRDAERWNDLSMNDRATLLCDIFEAWMRGDYSPMKPLNDSVRAELETKTEQCETCKKPLPPLAQWSMPSCPACVQKAETAPCEHSWVISNFEAPRCLWCLVEKSAVNTSPALLTESCNGAHEWVPFSNKDADVKIELCGKCGLEKHTTKATIRAVRNVQE